MNREEKILLAIERGYTCNPKTGKVYGPYDLANELKAKTPTGYLSFHPRKDNKRYNIKQ